MKLVTPDSLSNYLKQDAIATLLEGSHQWGFTGLGCDKWLRETPAKRHIFNDLYGDLLSHSDGLRVLDVGGGLTSLTPLLARRHDYYLVDLLAHDDRRTAEEIQALAGRQFVEVGDWWSVVARSQEKPWDVVIANDLFPNVDQRLKPFLDRVLPLSKEVRLSLTFYPDPRWYVTRRVDADEMLTLLAWDHRQLAQVLADFEGYIVEPNFELFEQMQPSVFENGRQVIEVIVRGRRESVV